MPANADPLSTADASPEAKARRLPERKALFQRWSGGRSLAGYPVMTQAPRGLLKSPHSTLG